MEAWQDVIHFWFEESSPKDWWTKNERFDETIRERFLPVWEMAHLGETASWRVTPRGRLAEIIVLDQFSRNMFRGKPEAFAQDQSALMLAKESLRVAADAELLPEERHFLYMPYMHSESPADHEEALKLFEKLGNKDAHEYERAHKEIIDRFGRYPHRNAILGRESTPEEIEFMKTHKGF